MPRVFYKISKQGLEKRFVCRCKFKFLIITNFLEPDGFVNLVAGWICQVCEKINPLIALIEQLL